MVKCLVDEPAKGVAMAPRRIGILAATAAIVIGIASAAWACVSVDDARVDDLFFKRAPAGQAITVSGSAWAAGRPVQLELRSEPSTRGEHLGTAVVDPAGKFSADVRVPAAPNGFYYLTITQDAVTRATPLEVIADSPGLAPAPAGTTGAGELWNGMRADSSRPGLADLSEGTGGSSLPSGAIVLLAALSGLLVLGVLMVVERRRPVRARAQP